MTRHLNLTALTVVLVVVWPGWSPVWADGGLLWYQPVTQAGDLAQTRQQAVLALHGDKLTYVIQSVYTGSAHDVVWVLPLPAAPTDVVAHADDRLFKALNAYTRPTFEFSWPSGGGGCVCMPNGAVPTGPMGLVQVEASGQTGVYDWAALTSAGSGALMDWLTSHGYAVPASASEVFDTYIQQGMHFLAIRLHETATTQ
jgi:hypothetical protein